MNNKRIMKLRHFFAFAMASVMALAACEEIVNLGMPSVTISTSEVTLAKEGGDATIKLVATRDWTVKIDDEAAAWLVVDPASGIASSLEQEVTVTALANDGYDREASVGFTIGMQTKYLTVKQEGSQGSAEALVMYSNDFDKTKAEKGGSGWSTYLDSFDGWMNATGTGLESVTYGFDRMTARTNSGNGSAGSYSDYVELGASGMNYLWFGSGAPYFAVKNIALPEGKTDFTLSFGTERYLYQADDNTFSWDEFKVYVSVDGNKWVKPAFEFAGGKLPNGRWDLASSTFTVPAGTASLSVYFASSLASAYAIDDVKLVQADAAGTVLDFANGEEFQVGDSTTGGGNTGGDDVVPESKGKKTVAEFIEAADKENYYELTGKVSGFNPTYCSFDLTDDSGKIYVYSVLDASKAAWTSKISNGGTITIYALYDYYEKNSQHEVVKAHIVNFTAGTVERPTDITDVTVEEFLKKEVDDTWYRLSGTVSGTLNTTHGNFDLTDETGSVYVYGIDNWSSYSAKFAVGDKVTIVGHRYIYTNPDDGSVKDEVMDAYIESWTAGEGNTGSGGGNGGELDPDAAWSYLFAKGDLGDSYSAPVTKTLNGAEWSFAMTGSTFLGWDSNKGRGLQMGKSKEPASEVTLSTSGISGNIKKIVVNTAGATDTDAELVVKVGETALGSPVKTTTTATDYTFEAETAVSGAVELKWTLTTAAVYIKSISVYTE